MTKNDKDILAKTVDITEANMRQRVEQLYDSIKLILSTARQRAYAAVNFALVESNWLIGQSIVEHEQHGEARAEYGKRVLKELAVRLSAEFGKGLDERELRKMRQFYTMFKVRDTLRPELLWFLFLVTTKLMFVPILLTSILATTRWRCSHASVLYSNW
ncbi:MAG: hypothetical protein IJT30_09005 [Muribaculaceae bacterium]|nr:hypothetical protein [Muribaculaceae bacterium]